MQKQTSELPMNSLKFSINDLTTDEAKLLADAYIRSGGDVQQMCRLLDVERLDMNVIYNPLVKKELVALRNQINNQYTLSDHLAQLQKIRDGALADENWKVGLSAEVAVGKAAGLYEPKKVDENPAGPEVKKMTVAELRNRLASINPSVPALEAPSLEDDEGMV